MKRSLESLYGLWAMGRFLFHWAFLILFKGFSIWQLNVLMASPCALDWERVTNLVCFLSSYFVAVQCVFKLFGYCAFDQKTSCIMNSNPEFTCTSQIQSHLACIYLQIQTELTLHKNGPNPTTNARNARRRHGRTSL